MELIFLGTGAGVPSKERNVSAIALTLLQELNSIWLFDCGEGTQHQILHTSIKPRKIDKIFITHLHGDHIYGLPGLLSSRSFQAGEGLLTVYGPKGIAEYIHTSLDISGTHLNYPLKIVEMNEGIILEDDKFTVHAKLLDHGIPSFGFRITEKDKTGELLIDKLINIGIKPGPIYSQIKSNKMVQLEDGQKLYQKDFIGPNKKGRVICILGDTRSQKDYSEFVKGADLLIHEATFTSDKVELAQNYFHSTNTEAASLAAKSSIKQLLLTHISSRYQTEDDQRILAEAREIFPETYLAKDFFQFHIATKN
ncbi:ribonuclease Z [Oceanobacillus polygoni]|uniref:Ribonuclease Z n=1 Tax=Oceanobacillus polygoni TaxID=1235259 RepID=A0A9X1CH95_9BACI|nr:ribonuclease Z [Oceanobacillus polygoni]MBP2077788.1 ribonuclease Z [Oceanobacillus polygoni]